MSPGFICHKSNPENVRKFRHVSVVRLRFLCTRQQPTGEKSWNQHHSKADETTELMSRLPSQEENRRERYFNKKGTSVMARVLCCECASKTIWYVLCVQIPRVHHSSYIFHIHKFSTTDTAQNPKLISSPISPPTPEKVTNMPSRHVVNDNDTSAANTDIALPPEPPVVKDQTKRRASEALSSVRSVKKAVSWAAYPAGATSKIWRGLSVCR